MREFSLFAKLLRWPAQRPRQSLFITLLITAAAALAVTRFHADTSFENLLPRTDPAANSLVRALNDFSAVDESLVLISLPPGSPAEQQHRLVNFAERFESAIHQDAAGNRLIDSISYRVDNQTRRFFQNVVVPAGLYYCRTRCTCTTFCRSR